MDVVIMSLQVIAAFSFLVAIHELGHLIFAKIFKMRVERYSIGFPPRLFGIKKGETDYCLGTIPLGGYVKISGMIDESLDNQHLQDEPKSWEFRSKPAWQRLIVMFGGIVFNVIIGVAIFIGVALFTGGSTHYPASEIKKYGIYAGSVAQKVGLQTGDKILKINGKDYQWFSDILDFEELLKDGSYFTIQRQNKILDVAIPIDLVDMLADTQYSKEIFLEPLRPFEIGQIVKGSGAAEADLKRGDKIIAVNSIPVYSIQEFNTIKLNYKNQNIPMSVIRNTDTLQVNVKISQEGTVGFQAISLLKTEREEYSVLESLQVGTKRAFSMIWLQAIAVEKIAKGNISIQKTISSPIGIARMFGTSWNWIRFWIICGTLSMVLAFMNFLPIPALDGGHILFLVYEIIIGKSAPQRFILIAQQIGMVLLLSLMVFAIGNDIIKIFL